MELLRDAERGAQLSCAVWPLDDVKLSFAFILFYKNLKNCLTDKVETFTINVSRQDAISYMHFSYKLHRSTVKKFKFKFSFFFIIVPGKFSKL